MSSSCDALLRALKTCLLESDCVQKDGRLPSDCLKHHTDELPQPCQNLRKATFECKRNMLDMRKRFRGNTVGMGAEKLQRGTGDHPPTVESHHLPRHWRET